MRRNTENSLKAMDASNDDRTKAMDASNDDRTKAMDTSNDDRDGLLLAVSRFIGKHPRIVGVICILIVLQILLSIPVFHDVLYSIPLMLVNSLVAAFAALCGVGV